MSFGAIGGGSSLHDAVTPDRLAAEDHDRLIRIEEQLNAIKSEIPEFQQAADDVSNLRTRYQYHERVLHGLDAVDRFISP